MRAKGDEEKKMTNQILIIEGKFVFSFRFSFRFIFGRKLNEKRKNVYSIQSIFNVIPNGNEKKIMTRCEESWAGGPRVMGKSSIFFLAFLRTACELKMCRARAKLSISISLPLQKVNSNLD